MIAYWKAKLKEWNKERRMKAIYNNIFRNIKSGTSATRMQEIEQLTEEYIKLGKD